MIKKLIAVMTFIVFIIGIACIETSEHPVIIGVITLANLVVCWLLYRSDPEMFEE